MKYRTSDQGMMILKNSTREENNIGSHFSKSWEKNKEVEVIFAIKKKVRNKTYFLKIGDTERKRCIVDPYQMKMRNKDLNKQHTMDGISDSISNNGNVNYKIN